MKNVNPLYISLEMKFIYKTRSRFSEKPKSESKKVILEI